MRSDRDIQRTPRRPVRKEGDTDAPTPEKQADAPFANIPVSHREPTGTFGGPRDGRRDDRRDDRRDGDRPQQRAYGERPPQRSFGDRPPQRRDDGRPPQRGPSDERRPFDDRPPQRAWSDRPPQRPQESDRPFGRPPERQFDRPQGPRRDDAPRGDRGPRPDPRGPQRFDGPPQHRPDRRPDGPYAGRQERRPEGRFEGRPEGRPAFNPERRPEPWGQQPPQRPERSGPAFRDDRQDDRRRVAPPMGDRDAAFRRDESRPPVRVPRSTEPNPEGHRLSKVLADRGVSSRREADDWIAAGWVKVDGVMAELGQRVLPTARIDIDPAAHQQQAQRVTILINKPIGYVSGQAEDGYEPASVLVTAANRWEEDPIRKPFHPGHARGLAPAGRLDIDSTGLLVLTQDGRIAKHLIGEDSNVEKEYLVRVEFQREGAFPEADMALLNHGLELDGVQLRPARVSWANEDQLRFVLREGRKRQIRRMCELVGLKVVGLKRVRIGSVVLGKLPAGQWRYLRDDERF